MYLIVCFQCKFCTFSECIHRHLCIHYTVVDFELTVNFFFLFQQVKAIADAGVNVVVSGGKFGDMGIHYLNKYGIMAVRLQSKFDVRRLCKTVNAVPLPKMVLFIYFCIYVQFSRMCFVKCC